MQEIKNLVSEKLGVQVLSVEENTLGCDQDVWIVQTPAQKVVVKLPKNDKRIRIQREVLACSFLAPKNIIVPTVLYHDNQYLIETFIEGTLGDQWDYSDNSLKSIFTRIGQVLKRMHSVSTEGFGMIKTHELKGEFATQLDYVKPGFYDLLDGFRKTGLISKQEAAQTGHYFEQNILIIRNSDSVLLHADFCLSNLIITPDMNIAVIDFADLTAGNPMIDLAKMYMNHYHDGGFQAFSAGYGPINLPQIEFFAFCWMTWLIPMLYKDPKNTARVNHLLRLFRKILAKS